MFTIRLFSLASRRFPTRCVPLHSPSIRLLSATSTRKAAESRIRPEALEAVNNSPTFQKISKSPEALSAVQKLAEVMQNSGVEPGSKPSTLQLLKLASKSEFREASKKVFEEFQKAGVDLSSKDVMDELQNIAKALVDPKS